MMNKKKMVILGGTGFIGGYLSSALSKRNYVNLSVVHKGSPFSNKLPNIKYYKIDGSKQGSKLGKIISDNDCLIILTQPNKNLIKNIIKFGKGIKKIVYASTLILYPNSPKKQNEDSPIKPVTDYEKNKVLEEKLLSSYANKNKVKLCIIRFANLYGDVKNRGIIQKIFIAIENGQKLIINNKGKQKRDYLFIEDVIPPLEYLIFTNQKNNIDKFNICSGRGYTLNQVISIIEEITNKKLMRVKGEKVKEKTALIGDNKKITNLSGINTQFSINEGLKKNYENYLKQKN